MRIFLSYHSPDESLATALKQALEARGDDVEVFFAPQSLRTGSFWVPQLGEAIERAAFDPDGTRVVSAGTDGTVRVWRYRLEDLVEFAIANLPRCLTPKERERFYLDPEDPPWCDRFKNTARAAEQ